MKFEDIAFDDVCDVCGKRSKVVSCASSYGPVSYSYCKECLGKRLEPYSAMVAYVSGAGYFPDDINEKYQKDVRRILAAEGISEQKFIKDVKQAVDDYSNY